MTRARRTVLAFAFTLAGVTYLDRICISAAAPFIMAELGLTVFEMSLVFSAFTLAYSLFEVPVGWHGDRVGARRVLARIVVWWSAFTMLTGAAWNLTSLVVVRFLFGAGEAGAFPTISHAFSRWIPARERGQANGVLFVGSRLGGATSPLLALALIERVGWRLSFVAFGAIGLVWATAWLSRYRDDPATHPRVDAEEAALIREGTTARPAGRTAPVPWAELLGRRNLYAICAMYFAFGYGLYFYFTWLPTYLITVLGFSVMTGGLLAALPFVLAGAANLAGGWLTDHLAATRGLRVARCWLGSASFAVCALLLASATVSPDPLLTAALLALALAAADFALAACWAVCLDVGAAHTGVVTGFMNTSGNLGGFLGPLVLGYLVERWESWTIPFVITAVIYLGGAAAWLVIDPTRRLTEEEA